MPMPKYTNDIVAGYVLYFTSKCVIEAMHVHASEKDMSKTNSAKLYVYDNGDTKVERSGSVVDADMEKIRKYIKLNYEKMYAKWKEYSSNGFYSKR